MSNWNTNVKLITDGVDTVAASAVNPIITQLVNRDQYLYDKLADQSDKTVLISYNQPIQGINTIGAPVYFNTTGTSAVLKAALGGFSSSLDPAHLTPSPSAYVFGLIKETYGTGDLIYGDIYIKGLITDINFSAVLDSASLNYLSGSALTPGPLYLSTTQPGNLSILPSGASIFVGYYIGATSLVLAPNIDSLNQLYFNYRLYLLASIAGTGSTTIATSDFTKVGWVNATDAATNYHITPPTGACFYYNLPPNSDIIDPTFTVLTQAQQQDALLLKKALPAYPGAYTMVFLNGVLQTALDTDHTNGIYVIDENGIWWMTADVNYTPWTTNSSFPVALQVFITKLNPNYAASVVTSLTSTNTAITITDLDGLASSTGDLNITMNLPIASVAQTTGTGSCVQSISYDASSGILSPQLGPVVNSLVAGPGLVVSTNTETSQTTVSLSNYSLNGEVTDLEPEEADYVYKGLTSYLRLKQPVANQKVGFVGKFKLPDSLPSNEDLYIRLIAFADKSTLPSTGNLNFEFDYAVTNEGIGISGAINSATLAVPVSNFTYLVQKTVYLDSVSDNGYFVIPANKITPGSYINFRISRLNDSIYNGGIGVIGVTWIVD